MSTSAALKKGAGDAVVKKNKTGKTKEEIFGCGDDEIDMTEYLETWRRAVEDRGTRISRQKTQFIDFKFGQDNGQGREPVKILGEELQRVYHFKYPASSVEETGGTTTEISESECSMAKLDGMQWSVV